MVPSSASQIPTCCRRHEESTECADDDSQNENHEDNITSSYGQVVRVEEPEDDEIEETFTIVDSVKTNCPLTALQEDAKEQHLLGDASDAWIQIH